MRTGRIGRRAKLVLGLLSVLTLAAPAFAVDIIDDPMQIDERAAELIQASNSLCWEMNRYHQAQPEYRQSYRAAKELWSRAGELREALRSGTVETEVLLRQVAEMNQMFAQIEKTLATWGPGDQSFVAPNAGPRTVVVPGAGVDLPILGRVGAPDVVVADDGPPQLQRRRLHPNSRGSKRSLERELAATKVALSYLTEDASITAKPGSAQNSSTPGNSSAPGAPDATGPVPPQPPSDAAAETITPRPPRKP